MAIAAQYVKAAYEFADRTFGAIDEGVLADFAAGRAQGRGGGRASVTTDSSTVYRQYEVPINPVHAAYLGSILMRELRGCVHIDAIHEVGLATGGGLLPPGPDDLLPPRLRRGRNAERHARDASEERLTPSGEPQR